MLRLVQLLVLSVPVLCGGAASTQHSIVEHGNHDFECLAVFAVMRQLNYVPRTKVVHRAVDIDSFTGDCCPDKSLSFRCLHLNNDTNGEDSASCRFR
jgi:hypothetical protein